MLTTAQLEALVGPYYEATNRSSQDLIERLKANVPPHVTRFGDGEMYTIIGVAGGNCDHHPYSRELGMATVDAIDRFVQTDNLWISNWFWWPMGFWQHGFVNRMAQIHNRKVEWCEHEMMMHLHGRPIEPVRDIYIGIRECSRKKVYIRPHHLAYADRLLRVHDVVEVPAINGWASFKSVLSSALSKITNDDLVLISFGMPAKPLMARIIEERPNCRVIDIGSGLDPLGGRTTRNQQYTAEELRQVYAGLL